MAKTLEDIRKHHQTIIEREKGGKEFTNDFVSLSEGSNLVRFLPGKEDPLDFFAESSVHKILSPDNKISNYTCRRLKNEDCPVCNFYFDLWKMHKELNLGKDSEGRQKQSKYGNLATQIKAKSRWYALAVIRDLQKKGEDPVKYVAMSQQLFSILTAAFSDSDYYDEKDPENTTILSLENGNDFDIVIGKKKTGNREFNDFSTSKAKAKKTRAGTPIEVDQWMSTKLNPHTLVVIGDYEEGKKIVENLRASLNTSTGQSSVSVAEDDDIKFEKGLQV